MLTDAEIWLSTKTEETYAFVLWISMVLVLTKRLNCMCLSALVLDFVMMNRCLY